MTHGLLFRQSNDRCGRSFQRREAPRQIDPEFLGLAFVWRWCCFTFGGHLLKIFCLLFCLTNLSNFVKSSITGRGKSFAWTRTCGIDESTFLIYWDPGTGWPTWRLGTVQISRTQLKILFCEKHELWNFDDQRYYGPK